MKMTPEATAAQCTDPAEGAASLQPESPRACPYQSDPEGHERKIFRSRAMMVLTLRAFGTEPGPCRS